MYLQQQRGRISCLGVVGGETESEEIPILRDAVLGIMTGKVEELSRREHTAASQLSAAERAELETQVGQQLIIRPSALREASDFVSMPRRRGMRCNCRSSSLVSTYQRGIFGIKVEYSSQHHSSCQHHQSGKQSWRYAASARLLPFVQRTVELGLSLTSGAGCFSIAPLLNAYCTVKRSESPVFKLFDEFPDRCGTKISSGSPHFDMASNYWLDGYLAEFIQYNWNLPMVNTELIHLIKTLEINFNDKSGSGMDKDENGNTMLHEAISLISLLPRASEELQSLFQKLIELAVVSGADMSALAYYDARPRYPRLGFLSREKPYTATNLVLIMTDDDRVSPASQEKFSQSYGLIKTCGLDDQLCDMLDWNTTAFHYVPEPVHRRLTDVKLLRENPELAEPLGFGEIAPYILHRSKESLVRYLQINKLAASAYKDKSCDPLCLALGWLDGLKILLDVGFEPRKALETAMIDEDFASFNLLLPHTSFVDYNDGVPSNWIFSFIHMESCHSTMILGVVQEFKFRQKKFWECRDEEKAVEADINGGRDSLNKQLSDDLSISMLPSAYHYEIWRNRQNFAFTTLLEILFAEGFEEVDLLNEDSLSPLCVIASSGRAFAQRHLCAEWFLAKGASANFNAPQEWPNVLFYLLPGLSKRQFIDEPLDDDITLYLRDTDPLRTDHCDCYCSASGCLPWHNYWNSLGTTRYRGEDDTPLTVMITMLECIVELFNLTVEQKELCYAELCRLEVFDCLGLTHTCCGHFNRYGCPMPEEERVQCQQEDSELKSHFDLIMAAYSEARCAHAGTIEQFWVSWWEDLGQILPALSSLERRWRMCYIFDESEEADVIAKRADRERARLLENGYGDFEDFADVIRMHFKRYLEPQTLPGEDSDDEWTDTDFSDIE